jgi:hypothetical protein
MHSRGVFSRSTVGPIAYFAGQNSKSEGMYRSENMYLLLLFGVADNQICQIQNSGPKMTDLL